MMSRRISAAGGILVFILALALPAMAETNFSISPPPIASPNFEAGKGYMKFRGSYISVEAPGLELSGVGFDFVPRTAFSDMLAADGQVGLFVMSGDMDMGGGATGDMSMMDLRLNVNLEVQPVNTGSFALIFMVGPVFDFGFSTVDYTFMGYSDTMNIDTVQYGIQAGLQAGIKAGNFHIAPFVTTSSMSGTTDTYSAYVDTSSDIEAYTTTSFGLDIEYTPWGLTLSSIVQEAQDSGTSNGADVKMYQIGWRKDF